MYDRELKSLLENNRAWAASKTAEDSAYFSSLSQVQRPDYLWIGCSDSRVPANEIVGLKSGELFVHRNIANVVPPGDLNCHSVIQYAVEVLGVRHIIVTGHYGCGGIKAAMEARDYGKIEDWLANIRRIYEAHREEITSLADGSAQADRLCELNVIAQVRNVAKTEVVRSAWKSGRELEIHGWIYALADGILHDLNVSIGTSDQ